ncbi:unnamed protein product [Sphagnum jensenii]|uniref:Uncharacterized protein n=1 Tax=Sphagnum jensenii TaxID=128206 RepID=A0ABP1BY07_9BRYO
MAMASPLSVCVCSAAPCVRRDDVAQQRRELQTFCPPLVDGRVPRRLRVCIADLLRFCSCSDYYAVSSSFQVSDRSRDLQQYAFLFASSGEKISFDLEQRLKQEHETCGSLWKLASSLVELGAPFCPLKNSEIKYRNRQSWWQHRHTGHTRRGKQRCDRSVLEAMQQQEDHHYSGMDSFIMCGKYVRYTNEQVEALEHVYHECPKPSSIRRQQLVKDCPILAHIEPKQIKVWFQNRRCREKQQQESSRLLIVNAKLAALNKLLMEENERLSKHSLQLTLENHVLRQELQQMPAASLGGIRNQLDQAALASTETSSDSVVSGGGLHPQATPQHSPQTPSPAADELVVSLTEIQLLSIAEETVTEFISKATGTAIDWIQLPGMKPGPHAIGIVAISHGCLGVAARACSLVGLEPSKVAEVLKDRPSWLPDCHRLSILSSFTTGNGGTVELIYTQMYAPTTLAPPQDFYTLRYTTILENRNMVVSDQHYSLFCCEVQSILSDR